MPELIRKIEGEIILPVEGGVKYSQPLSGLVGMEDYFEVYGLIAYLQNLTKADDVTDLIKPINFGLINGFNKEMITLEIDY